MWQSKERIPYYFNDLLPLGTFFTYAIHEGNVFHNDGTLPYPHPGYSQVFTAILISKENKGRRKYEEGISIT